MMGYYTNYSKEVKEMSQRYLLNGSLDDPGLFWRNRYGKAQEVKTFVQDFEGILKCYSKNLHLYQSGFKPETEEIVDKSKQIESSIDYKFKPAQRIEHGKNSKEYAANWLGRSAKFSSLVTDDRQSHSLVESKTATELNAK
ncbi:hypothetical protein AVEN_80015-1 [Araneus ventricosus]|uniref:Uncharacterized protein n=1 Tax=Araneus ventricosus TaxID=182803 RepID=A0A4Y2FNA0_ARAVE|nr:hypothetical protein AVEN_80015-1 [Araneus ventricosus]